MNIDPNELIVKAVKSKPQTYEDIRELADSNNLMRSQVWTAVEQLTLQGVISHTFVDSPPSYTIAYQYIGG